MVAESSGTTVLPYRRLYLAPDQTSKGARALERLDGCETADRALIDKEVR
jgi:hypothetical protein